MNIDEYRKLRNILFSITVIFFALAIGSILQTIPVRGGVPPLWEFCGYAGLLWLVIALMVTAYYEGRKK